MGRQFICLYILHTFCLKQNVGSHNLYRLNLIKYKHMHIKKAKWLFKMYDFIFINQIMTEKTTNYIFTYPPAPLPQ